MKRAPKRFKVLSLFSGGMGLDIGLEQTGRLAVLACVEKVPAFAETIRRNRDAGLTSNRKLLVYERDIRELDPDDVMADLGVGRGDLDLVIGGPPCQSFSTSGRRRTVCDPRGTLLWQFLRFIAATRPKMFLMENVRGLISAALRHRRIKDRPGHGGPPLEADEEPGSVVRKFVDDLDGDYRVDCFEVNAVNYGAPQLRERALFVGNRFNRLVEFPEPTYGQEQPEQPNLFPARARLAPYRTLRDALEGLAESDPVIMNFSPRKLGYLALVPPGGNWRCLPDDVARESMGRAYHAKGGRSGWWRRLSFDLPCPTLITMPNHAGTSLCHPTELRALSLREYARIQEFPDEWEFCGTVGGQYAQAGNAVPVRLGRVSGGLLGEHLASIYREDLRPRPGQHPRFRLVYLKAHIRTRQWFKAGRTFVWQDGADNDHAKYGSPKTHRRVTSI